MERPLLLARLDPSADPVEANRPWGNDRRVGIEVEFAGLELEVSAGVVAGVLGGEVNRLNEYEFEIETSDLGTFRLEVDNRLLLELVRDRERGRTGLIQQAAETVLSATAGTLAPLELVTPPVPWTEVTRMDEVVSALGEAGATGTREGLMAAFGVHYNPNVPDLGASSLRDHLRAYLVLEPWLRTELAVDWSRRVTPFIDPFPVAYTRELLATDEDWSLDELVTHYLSFNPTRNRALDMLPLLAELRPAIVREHVDDPLLKPRPAFHYRLTNSHVGEPGWSLSAGWRYWLVVEDLARDEERLEAMARAFREHLDEPFAALRSSWAETTPGWLA